MAKYECPVCAYKELEIAPYSNGLGSTEYCQCCGFQFGVTDDAYGVTFDEWRKVWIARGMPWDSKGYIVPKGWDAKEQLKVAGFWPFKS